MISSREKELIDYMIQRLRDEGVIQAEPRIRPADAAKRYGVSAKTVLRWMQKKDFPKPLRDKVGYYWKSKQLRDYDLLFHGTPGYFGDSLVLGERVKKENQA